MALPRSLAHARSMSQDMTGSQRIDPYMKWTGGKNHPEYIGGYRRALRNAGGNRRVVEPFVGSGSIAMNLVPGKEALLGDFDEMNIGFHNAVKTGSLGNELDYSRFLGDNGTINRKTFFEDLRGGTPMGRIYPPTEKRSYPLDTRWPPREGSLNHLVHDLQQRGVNPASSLDAIKMWAMAQNAGFRGDARFNRKPSKRHGVDRWFNISSNEEEFAPVNRNYLAYPEITRNFDFEPVDFNTAMDTWELDPKNDILFNDSPYLEEAGNYDHGLDQAQMVNQLRELMEDAMPIVATNSEYALPLFRDAGFDTWLNDRKNNYGAKAESRGKAREMVAVTPGLISENEWKNIGKSEQLTLFDRAWDVVRANV